MFRKIGLLTLLLTTFCTMKIEAYNECCDSTFDPCCCEAEWGVYADWLYWKARRCQLDYAIPFDTSPDIRAIGDVSSIEPSYSSGFRVGLFYKCDNSFYDVFYTRFHNKDTDVSEREDGNQTTARNIQSMGGPFGGSTRFINGEYCMRYDTVDVLMGTETINCLCFESYFFGGFKYASIDQEFKSFFSQLVPPATTGNAVGEFSATLDMNGYGINFGWGTKRDLWCCLNFMGRASFDVLLGNFHRTAFYEHGLNGVLTNVDMDLTDDGWCMVSALNLMLGLSYDHNFNCGCWCGTLGLAIGYEFHHYLGMPDFINFDLAQTNSAEYSRNTQQLGLDGLFIRVFLGF